MTRPPVAFVVVVGAVLAFLVLVSMPAAAQGTRVENGTTFALPSGAQAMLVRTFGQPWTPIFDDVSQTWSVTFDPVGLVGEQLVTGDHLCTFEIPVDWVAGIYQADPLAYCTAAPLFPEPPASAASGASSVPATPEQLLVGLLGLGGFFALMFGFNTGRGFT